MRVLSRLDVLALVDVAALIPVMEHAMQRVSERRVAMPIRSVLPIAPGKRLGMMPGFLADPPAYGIKMLSLFADNPAQGRSSHAGAMMLFDLATGLPRACVEASSLTALRTAAASGAATRLLARPDADTLGIIGCGEQAGSHLAAMRALHPFRQVRVWGRDPAKAAAFAAAHPGLDVAATVAEAVAGAGIVCTTTSSQDVLLPAGILPTGVHVNAAGATRPPTIELAPECLTELSLFCDYLPALEEEAFEYVQARQRGLIPAGTATEIGDVLLGRKSGRRDAAERTLYRSLGVAAQDLAAACFILDRAEAAGRGTLVDFA